MEIRNADSPEGVTPTFWYRDYDALGWATLDESPRARPTHLGGFDPGVESSAEDSGWREWDTPSGAEFDVVRPGGYRVTL